MEFSTGKILLLLLVIVLIFGTSKLPKIGEDLGKAMRSFKKASEEPEPGPNEQEKKRQG